MNRPIEIPVENRKEKVLLIDSRGNPLIIEASSSKKPMGFRFGDKK